MKNLKGLIVQWLRSFCMPQLCVMIHDQKANVSARHELYYTMEFQH